jgi:hypothetical protein
MHAVDERRRIIREAPSYEAKDRNDMHELIAKQDSEGAVVDGWYRNQYPMQGALPDMVERVLEGAASAQEVALVSNLYAYSQEKMVGKSAKVDLHRGITLDREDERTAAMLQALEEGAGEYVAVGTIGHWSSSLGKAGAFSENRLDDPDDVMLVLHKTWPRKAMLDNPRTRLSPFAMTEEEYVPISTGEHRIARVKHEVYKKRYLIQHDTYADIDVYDVWLE